MRKTVLIVEDDEDTRTIYRAAIAKRGYHVLTATHGAEGVHLARRHRPDLILLDIRMPVMDGLQAMRYLRTDRETAGIPICAISAYAPDQDVLERLKPVEFDCFLTKPITPSEVVAAIEAQLGPPGGGK